jgi:leucyl aminopeptidase
MEISAPPSLKARKQADVLFLPFWKGKKKAEAAADLSDLLFPVDLPILSKDFQGEEGEIALLYPSGQPEKRIALIGLGQIESVTVEKLRRHYAHATKLCHKKKWKEATLVLPESSSLSRQDCLRGALEGFLLSNYLFTSLKHDALKKDLPSLVEKIALVGARKEELEQAKKYAVVNDAVNRVRDLVNGNADDVTPQYLGQVAKTLEKRGKRVKTTLFDKKRIEKEKMGLLLAVNRASFRDPAFILVEYKGAPGVKEHTVLVGKGVTFDSGGLNLKPTGSMETMKADMAGAAAVLGVIDAAASLELKKNITGIIVATENSIGSKSYKPGDVYKSYAGKTVEIGNTDAEGRLILADALAYAVQNLKPTRIIDLATLTGAVEVALGNEASGLLSNHDVLADLLISAGAVTGERVWRLPLYDEYKELLKSDVADIKSTGGRPAGCLTAAMFLKEFVGDVPWAHLDIAGTAYLTEGKRYLPKHATGVGVRLILSLLENL